ncbi:MAG: S8 family serine peptidase [Planctomycetes bacterium]|nr:S8 family serine peptidase [Planctomycetota bacterium]
MRSCLLVSLVSTLLLSSALAQASFAPGDVLVLPAAKQAAAVEARIRAAGLEIAETDKFSGVMRVRVPVGSEDEWVKRLGDDAGTEYAEKNGLGSGGLVPNDTHFVQQWHLRNTGQAGGTPGADIRATDAWDVTTGSTTTIIAVLDTGIDSDHTDFIGRIAPGGYDFVNQDNDPEADHPHGSWVSGAMCANANNGFGVAGVDWQCKVLPIKVLNSSNGGTTANLASALNYVATLPQVQVVSMSLINYPGSSTLINALQAARNAGKILISCAGNGGIGNADVSYPGASPLTISIGATTRFDSRASFSGTGAALDFVAPGLDIATVMHDSAVNSYSVVSGCSFATPITAGIVGLLLAEAARLNIPPLSQQDVYDLLRLGAIDQVGPPTEDTPGRDNYFGHGRLDARTAVDAVSGLYNCNNGNVGAQQGGPYDVLFVNGAAGQIGNRNVTVPANVPFQISMAVPPSNPQPSPTPPFFVLWAAFGDQAAQTPVQLPMGIGELCLDPSGPTAFAQLGAMAPWSTTIPALPALIRASLQGAIFDTPAAHIAVTNLVSFDVQTAPPPVINSVTPRAAAVGATVTILGSGFLPGLTLEVNGIVTPTLSTSPTAITFAGPAGLPCNTSLTVTNADTQSASSPFNVSPVITSVLGIGGYPAAGGTQLLIVGQNFVPGTSVTIGGNPMTINSTSASLINGILPPGAVGPAAVVVTTPFSCAVTGSLTYTP